MIALFVARLEKPSHRLISSVVMIAVGTAAASYGEINLSYMGLLIMFSSECFEAVRLVMTQMLLTGLRLHPSALWLLLLLLIMLSCTRVPRPCTSRSRGADVPGAGVHAVERAGGVVV